MTESLVGEAVLQALDEGFTGDKQPVRIGPISEFGVVEMTRRRGGMTLAQSLQSAPQWMNNRTSTIMGKCPICKVEPSQETHKPFYSKRCADIDLHR